VKVSVGASAVGERKNPQKRTFRSYISPIWREKPLVGPVGSAQNFALGVKF